MIDRAAESSTTGRTWFRVCATSARADAQGRDPRPRTLALLEAGDPLTRVGGVAHDPGERIAPALADQPAVMQRDRRLVGERRRERPLEIVELSQRVPRRGEHAGFDR